MTEGASVYIVDDDKDLRASLVSLLSVRTAWAITAFDDGESWLKAQCDLTPGCALVDYNMPGLSGLAVLEEMRKRNSPHQIVMVTGEGSISVAVQAMRAGANDFVEKPVSFDVLENAIETALARLEGERNAKSAELDAKNRIGRLKPREMDVMMNLADGLPNKIIAHRLGLSVRTVEVYRANLMDKLEVKSLADVIRTVFSAGLMG